MTPYGPRVVFCQPSDELLTPDDSARAYYRESYARMPGYVLPRHFMEIPFWIPVIAGMLPRELYRHELHVVQDVAASAEFLCAAGPDDIFLFSVLEANVEVVRALAATGRRFVVGGYVQPAALAFDNVTFLDGLDDLVSVFPDLEADEPADYTLFSGLRCIPRYSLSTGCGFRCRFCTVPTQLLLTPPERVEADALALWPLDFELVFLDDKSFGEARNWREAGRVGRVIRSYNPGFDGFIVQTPPSLAARPGFLEEAVQAGVRYLEMGVEIVDDEQLARLRKPFRRRHLDQAVEEARRLGLPVIPNLIMGIPGADYEQTVRWVEDNADVVPVVNVNWLAVHHGNERGTLPVVACSVADGDQNSDRKSWLDDVTRRRDRDAVHRIYQATLARDRRTDVARMPR